jgi:hypothetical protein
MINLERIEILISLVVFVAMMAITVLYIFS